VQRVLHQHLHWRRNSLIALRRLAPLHKRSQTSPNPAIGFGSGTGMGPGAGTGSAASVVGGLGSQISGAGSQALGGGFSQQQSTGTFPLPAHRLALVRVRAREQGKSRSL